MIASLFTLSAPVRSSLRGGARSVSTRKNPWALVSSDLSFSSSLSFAYPALYLSLSALINNSLRTYDLSQTPSPASRRLCLPRISPNLPHQLSSWPPSLLSTCPSTLSLKKTTTTTSRFPPLSPYRPTPHRLRVFPRRSRRYRHPLPSNHPTLNLLLLAVVLRNRPPPTSTLQPPPRKTSLLPFPPLPVSSLLLLPHPPRSLPSPKRNLVQRKSTTSSHRSSRSLQPDLHPAEKNLGSCGGGS